jgi:hypothetical protein
VTAEEWEACRDPRPMLEAVRGKASDRKFRLFACACARRHPYPRRDARAAVRVAEGFADGLADEPRLHTAHARVYGAPHPGDGVAFYASFHDPHNPCYDYFNDARTAVALARNEAARYDGSKTAEGIAQCRLIRCMFTNPFRPPFTVSPAVLAHNDGVAVKVATVTYNDRDPATGLLDPARLAILADALEEAGVYDAAALQHLRGPGPHVRGCHAVDAVLGKS